MVLSKKASAAAAKANYQTRYRANQTSEDRVKDAKRHRDSPTSPNLPQKAPPLGK